MMVHVVEADHERAVGPTELFGSLALRTPRSAFAAPVSLVAHAVALTLLVGLSLSRLDTPAQERDYRGVLLYDPPPPPPLALNKGPGGAEASRRTAPPDPRPIEAFTAPVEAIPVEPVQPTPAEDLADSGGSPVGSDRGDKDGMEGGQDDGEVGGLFGGVRGGVVGGTGSVPLPVANPDQMPRLLHKVRPEYPQQAFVQKIQGRVMLRILIDASGRVADTKVTESIPLLDAAAVAAVKQWTFAPAIKDGRPVASWAFAPVFFQLY